MASTDSPSTVPLPLPSVNDSGTDSTRHLNTHVTMTSLAASRENVAFHIVELGGESNITPLKPPPRNLFIAARGHVQRVIDVALLVSNMSRLATIVKRRQTYEPFQVYMLAVALIVSMVAQVVAGVTFFITHEWEINQVVHTKRVDYTAYGCVAVVMILNIFISTFDATWTTAP